MTPPRPESINFIFWIRVGVMCFLAVSAGGSWAEDRVTSPQVGPQTLLHSGSPLFAPPSAGQCPPPGESTLSGFSYQLPAVPQMPPRPAEGGTFDTQFVRESPPQPLASLFEKVSGQDAVLEVVVGRSRLLTLRGKIISQQGPSVVAVGDPAILDFEVLPNPQLIRLIGKSPGITDLSITTADGETYSLEVHVLYDLNLLRAQIQQLFPDAQIKLSQLGEHLVVEGQARSSVQAAQIIQTLETLVSGQGTPGGTGAARRTEGGAGASAGGARLGRLVSREEANGSAPGEEGPYRAQAEARGGGDFRTSPRRAQIINLLRVPGVNQVMLKVRVAELNRTALREIGASFLFTDPSTGTIIGTRIGAGTVNALATLGLGGLVGTAESATGGSAGETAFGIFPSGDWEILLRALRDNQLVTILAEPNLVTTDGHPANFLAGGEFPVPVPQTSGAGGGAAMFTIEWKRFGVQLDFVPYLVGDDLIRLHVLPEVSALNIASGVEIMGTRVPGIDTRRAQTTVELKEGQTLVIAGLLQVTIEGGTARIPGLGDLPYIGTMFSNNSHKRVEKELLVMVTPHLVSAMEAGEVPPVPGEDIQDPNDLEFFLLNRIEGRTGRGYRSTMGWQDAWEIGRLIHLERRYINGPVGFSN